MNPIVHWIINAFIFALILFFVHALITRRLFHHWRLHFETNERQERLFLSAIAFYVTALGVRGITFSIHQGFGPFHDVTHGGMHIHHMVWGILTLLVVGYLWLWQVGLGMKDDSQWASAITAVLFGIGAALTLDETALWLHLQDVYWMKEGHISVQALLIFGGMLGIGFFGGRFFHTAVKDMLMPMKMSKLGKR